MGFVRLLVREVYFHLVLLYAIVPLSRFASMLHWLMFIFACEMRDVIHFLQ